MKYKWLLTSALCAACVSFVSAGDTRRALIGSPEAGAVNKFAERGSNRGLVADADSRSYQGAMTQDKHLVAPATIRDKMLFQADGTEKVNRLQDLANTRNLATESSGRSILPAAASPKARDVLGN
jgi:hypothetical protein